VAEKPITPPWRKAIQELNSPNHSDGFYTELVNRDDSAYQEVWPIKRGTPYANIKGADDRIITRYASNPLRFLKQLRPGNSSSSDFGATDQAVIWVWATDELAENTYNADIDYPGESVTVSRYVRTSHTRRKDYEANPAAAYVSTFTGLLSVAIGAAGTGYTQATATIATGATAEAVCFGGAIIDWIVTNEGTGVTNGAALTITGNGTGATATARIQPAAAVLTHQEKKELPPDDPRSHDYVQVIRVYEVLPGVTLTTQKYDPDNNTFIFTDKTVKLTSAITEGLTFVDAADNTVTLIESEAIDAVKSLEIATTWTEPVARSSATQIETGARVLPYRFPNFVDDLDDWILTAGLVGFSPGFTQNVIHVTKSYWVLTDAGMPTLVLDGLLELATIANIFGDGRGYPDVIVNGGTDYFLGGITVTTTASTPNATTYLSDFVGGDPKAILGSVTMINRFLYRVDRIYIQFRRQASPTYT
jgi:hypothetical protein